MGFSTCLQRINMLKIALVVCFEAIADADAAYLYGGYGYGHNLGYSRFGYAARPAYGYSTYAAAPAYGYSTIGYGHRYYGKRSAEAEPEAEAKPEADAAHLYGGYGYGHALGYSRYGYAARPAYGYSAYAAP